MKLTHRKAKFFEKIKNRNEVIDALGVLIFSTPQAWYGLSFQKVLVVSLLHKSQSH